MDKNFIQKNDLEIKGIEISEVEECLKNINNHKKVNYLEK